MASDPFVVEVLRVLLARHAYTCAPRGFVLASGARSDEYLDCKQALSHPEVLDALGKIVISMLDRAVVAVGGLTMGADPIAYSTARASLRAAKRIRWFNVRKTAKIHGREKMIEGNIATGETVAVVDDVVTSGGSTIEAIKKCREAGLHVAQVIVLVDREQGGMETIRGEVPGVPVAAIFRKREIRDEWDSLRRTSAPVCG